MRHDVGGFLFTHAFPRGSVVVSVQLLWESSNSPQISRRSTQPSAMRSITALETPPACEVSQYRHRYWCGIFSNVGISKHAFNNVVLRRFFSSPDPQSFLGGSCLSASASFFLSKSTSKSGSIDPHSALRCTSQSF